MGLQDIIRIAGVGAVSAVMLVGGPVGVAAAAADTVTVTREPVYAAPGFQAAILGEMTGTVRVSCETTADAGSNAGGVVMLEVRWLGFGDDVGYIAAPVGQAVDVFC